MSTPAPKSAMGQIRTGKPGRPADVRSRVTSILARTLFAELRTSELIPAALSDRRIRAEAITLADELWEAVHASGFRLLHARLASELAVLTGEIPPADDPSLPKPPKNDPT